MSAKISWHLDPVYQAEMLSYVQSIPSIFLIVLRSSQFLAKNEPGYFQQVMNWPYL